MSELNLKEYIFKKVKNFQNDPNLYIQVVNQALKERKLDEETDRDLLLNRLNDVSYAEYPLQLIINEAYTSKRKDLFTRSFVNEVGYLLPGTDFITGIKMDTKVNGMKIPFITLNGQIKTLLKWSKSNKIHLGIDSNLEETKQRKIEIPYFYKVNLRIEVKDDSRFGHQEILHFLDEIDPQSRLTFQELNDIFEKVGNTIDDFVPEVMDSFKDKFVILNGCRWGQMKPLTHWVKSGKQIAIKSTIAGDGTVDINKQLNGQGATEKVTYEDEVVVSVQGQPLIQQKIGTETSPIHIPCFSLSLITESSEVRNFVNVEVTNSIFADVKIWLASFNFMLNKIQSQFGILKKEEESSNPFSNFDNFFRGTPLILFGRVSSIKENPRKNEEDPTQVSFWINASMVIDKNFLYLDETERTFGSPIETILAEFPNLGIYRDLKDFKIDLTLAKLPSNVKVPEQTPNFTSINPPSSTPIAAPTKPRAVPKDPQYAQKVDAINQEIDDREKFRLWVNELTYKFKSHPEGKINQKDLGNDLVMILTQTGNIWNPDADFEYRLADSSIFDDQQKTLYKWWSENIKQSISKQPVQQGNPVTQVPIQNPVPMPQPAIRIASPPNQGGELTEDDLRREYFQFYVDLNKIIDKNTQTFDRRSFNQVFIRWALKENYIYQAKNDDPIFMIVDTKKVREFNNALNKFFFENKKPASYYWQDDPVKRDYWDLNICQKCKEEKLVFPGTGHCFDCDEKEQPVNEKTIQPAGNEDLKKILEAKTVNDLRDEAKVRGLSGYSKMKKAELIEAIIQNETPVSTPQPEPVKTKQVQLPIQASPAASDKPANLSEKEWKELKDLEASIVEWKKAMPTMNFTFEELFTNYKGFFPPFVDESYKPIIDQILEKINNNQSITDKKKK